MNIPDYHEGALVSIFNLDGTVEVSIGGVELGQGINTKVAQVVAYTLGIPLEDVAIAITSTTKTPDNSNTGGSGTSECCARAAQVACEELNARLAPFKAKAKSWIDALNVAQKAGVALAAYGSYQGADPNNHFPYATYGVSCSEVEIDVLTGEIQILRADIHMDLGISLNPMIDIGQLEGGFVMTLGYLFTETSLYDAGHHQLNLGTWEYKIPSAYDIPIELNVSLLGVPNPASAGCMKSKASAEPSMPTAISALFAVKQAIYAAREDAGDKSWFNLNIPCTVEQVQQHCLVTKERFVV